VISAIRRAAPGCTLMMPTFPFSASTREYLTQDPVYDARTLPSRSGALTEALRLMPGARRSLHPTHPCAALGPKADELIDGSENSVTPFGDDSTYGRFSRMPGATLLLLHTNNTSIVHRFQEMAAMPNLFLEGTYRVRGLDESGAIRERRVAVHRPVVPLYVLMAGDQAGSREYVWFPDYVLQFPEYNRRRIDAVIKSEAARRRLRERQEQFYSDGIFRVVRLRDAEIMAIDVMPWQERICRDLADSIREFADDYRLERLEDAQRKGLLTH
jgi:aminoglycoside N3'-acetyltransferase